MEFESMNKKKKRVGRGRSSGIGKTSGRGHNGQGSRSGGGVRPGFEGGQLALVQRLPKKRGFKSIHIRPEVLNVEKLNKFDNGEKVTPKSLMDKKIIRKASSKVKILGEGELSKKLTVEADAFSESALASIEKAGGKAILLERYNKVVQVKGDGKNKRDNEKEMEDKKATEKDNKEKKQETKETEKEEKDTKK